MSNIGQVCCSSSCVSHLISVCVCLFLSIPDLIIVRWILSGMNKYIHSPQAHAYIPRLTLSFQAGKYSLSDEGERQWYCHCGFWHVCQLLKAIFLPLDTNFRAKHLHSPAGSFGYVAPKVLKKEGHGKAVDLWSTASGKSPTPHFP